MNIAIIGGGWAGLSAACHAHWLGLHPTVFESGPVLGGRARSVPNNALDTVLDNGQHILLSAYQSSLGLFQRLHGEEAHLFQALPFVWESADGHLNIAAKPGTTHPLGLLWAFARARGLSRLSRWRAIQALAGLKLARWRTPPGATVSQWLQQQRQPPQLVHSIWQPLCLAAMNTHPDQACAQLFANVLRDSLGQGAQACRFVLPRVDLSRLWQAPALQDLDIRLRHTVRSLRYDPAGLHVDGECFDAVIVATPPRTAHKLLSQLPVSDTSPAWLAGLPALQALPIATLSLRLAQRWVLPQAMLMLKEDPPQQAFGQWVFDRAAFMADDDTPVLNIVISHAQHLADLAESAIVDGVIRQLQTQLHRAGPMPDVVGHQLITEKRATLAALPGLQRPSVVTPWPHVQVAGDWTDTGYPAVLEGAIRSGQQAAEHLARSLHARP